MRILVLLACGGLAACTSGAVTVPSEDVIREVPQGGYGGYEAPESGTVATSGGEAAAGTNLMANGDPAPIGVGSPNGNGPALDDDKINLLQWTLEQQKIDAAIAERNLEAARSKLVVVQPGPLPSHPEGVNIALFAQQTTNAVGEARYDRSLGARVASVGNCGRFRDADAAERAFLAGGGPETDRYGIDPDGDGFACGWDPTPYRALR